MIRNEETWKTIQWTSIDYGTEKAGGFRNQKKRKKKKEKRIKNLIFNLFVCLLAFGSRFSKVV